MQDRRRDVGEFVHRDARQVFLEEATAAGYVHRRVLGAVHVPRVVRAPDVADVVIQRADDAELEEPLADRRPVAAGALVAVEQPRHGERDLEGVLQVVVLGVAARITGEEAAIHGDHVVERTRDRRRLVARVEVAEDADDFELHADRIRGVDPVRDVEVAAAEVHQRPATV